MGAMFKRRCVRSLVSVLAVLALLMCQAAGLAYARKIDSHGATDNAAGCHSLPEHDGNSGKVVHPSCDSAQVPGDSFKVPPVALSVLPAALTLLDIAPSLTSVKGPPPDRLAGAPPPLRVVQCRFLN